MSSRRRVSSFLSFARCAAWSVLACGIAISQSGCGDDDDKDTPVVAGTGGAAASGAGLGKAGSGGSGVMADLGASCSADVDCGSGMVCDKEQSDSVPLPGAPGGSVPVAVFPGGSCTPHRAAAYDPTRGSCDPTVAAEAQGCGADGVCSIIDQLSTGTSTPVVGCRKACKPSATDSGCDRVGYTCDFSGGICTEGCLVDAECRVTGVDTNDDGEIDNGVYDPTSAAVCDSATSRCKHDGGSQQTGQSCMRDDDCASNGACLGGNVAGVSFPGGFCSHVGCELSGLECEAGSACQPLRPWFGQGGTVPLCFQQCKVGAEPKEQQLGSKGHGVGCRDGYRCHYNGGNGVDSGVCVGGVYNDVTTNNVGATCKTSTECYSPYGQGYCMIYSVPGVAQPLPGICTIMDCAVPGMPADMCGAGNLCVATGDDDNTMCSRTCKAASECPASFGCTDDDNVPETPKVCFPLCATKNDCRPNEQCKLVAAGARAGTCMLQ
jgi:hypothetical protein